MEELSVSTGSDFIDDGGFKVEENGSWYVFTGTSLREEGIEGIITSSDGLIRWHLSVGLDTVLKTIEFPTSVTNLNTSLANVNRNNFSHL